MLTCIIYIDSIVAGDDSVYSPTFDRNMHDSYNGNGLSHKRERALKKSECLISINFS